MLSKLKTSYNEAIENIKDYIFDRLYAQDVIAQNLECNGTIRVGLGQRCRVINCKMTGRTYE